MSLDILNDELAILESVYPEEFHFVQSESTGNPSRFDMEILPATAGDTSKQNISVILRLEILPDYPSRCPKIMFVKPRGLSDLQLVGLTLQLEKEASHRKGGAMIYDLIDVVRNYLTQTNFPTIECPFCLCDIKEGDEFYKTPCFHYYHTYCLRRYLEYLRKEASTGDKEPSEKSRLTSCIVCRYEFGSPVTVNAEEGWEEPSGLGTVSCTSVASPMLSEEQLWRNKIFEQQKLKKGLIQPDPGDHMVITLNHIPEIERRLEVAGNSASVPADRT